MNGEARMVEATVRRWPFSLLMLSDVVVLVYHIKKCYYNILSREEGQAVVIQ